MLLLSVMHDALVEATFGGDIDVSAPSHSKLNPFKGAPLVRVQRAKGQFGVAQPEDLACVTRDKPRVPLKGHYADGGCVECTSHPPVRCLIYANQVACLYILFLLTSVFQVSLEVLPYLSQRFSCIR